MFRSPAGRPAHIPVVYVVLLIAFCFIFDGKRWGERTHPQSRSRLIQLGLRLRIRGCLAV